MTKSTSPSLKNVPPGVRYKIDEVGEVRRAASTKAGGVGMRYHIRLGEKWNYMWLEEDRWFMERK